MKERISVQSVLETIEKADLAACSEAVSFINSLDFYQYSQEELKLISDRLGTRLHILLHLEIRPAQQPGK